VFDIAATVAPVRRGERCDGLRFLMRDVTVQRAIERENAMLRDQLESAVAERTVELEEALATARELYEATELASRRKSEFMAFLSHEVRTPMQAVSGYTEIMLMELHGTLTAAQRADLERMQRGQRHIVGILNQLLDYARIENGTLDLTVEPASLEAVIESAMELVRPQAEAAGVQLRRVGEALLVRVDVDKARQILVNLLGNAVKFGWQGGHVTIGTARGAGQAIVMVDDEGPGIARPLRAQVFEPFVHLERGAAGTGLGLPISRRLARAMGGDLTIEEKDGAGARFVVRLPLASG
jgi:signal transduction histidine kinase